MPIISPQTLVLIDGSSFLYRAYYGLRPLHTSSGIPVQAVYGFCRSLKKMIDDCSPSHMVLVWDSTRSAFRTELYEAYKANRQKAPSDLITQRDYIQKIATSMGLFQVVREGWEADDLIASLATQFLPNPSLIVTPDKDLQQLINAHVHVLDPFKNEVIDQEAFEKKNGFSPKELLLYHALLGDSSDNIPGVKGIGKKTAHDLASTFKTLENLYKKIDTISKERTRTLLKDQEQQARLSLELFTLRIEHLPITLSDLTFHKDWWKKAYDIFSELEFKSFVRGTSHAPPSQAVLFSTHEGTEEHHKVSGHASSAAAWKCTIVTSKEILKRVASLFKATDLCAFDTETSGINPFRDTLVGISVAFDEAEAFYIPLAHCGEDAATQLSKKEILEVLKPFFEDEKVHKVAHNSKFDEQVLWNAGVNMRGVVFDSLLAASLLRNEEWQKIGLKRLSMQYFNEPMTTFKEVVGKKKSFAEVLIADGASYAAHDALQTFKLKSVLSEKLEKIKKLKTLFYTLEMPLSKILILIERTGVMLDCSVLQKLNIEIDRDLAITQGKIDGFLKEHDLYTEKGINLNSPKQIEELLFDKLHLPHRTKSAQGRRSTGHDILQELAARHPIPALIVTYRELFKLKSTYVEPLQQQVNERTGRIHTTFNQTDVSSGRLSSSEPNLQNIPTQAGYGIKVRSAFVAPKGSLFLSADYSQIELRVLAHITKDPALTSAFLHNRDVHAQTAAQLFDVDLKNVTSHQRQIGKRINFSIIYGLTPYGLSRELGIPPSEAKTYIEKYFVRYAAVARWIEEVVVEAKKVGYVETWWGRRRYVPALHERNRTLYEAARRVAINMPVQGTSAEVVKFAMINLQKRIETMKLKARMILQIHDEIIVEFPVPEEEVIVKVVKEVMEGVVDWEIPFKVDVRVGKDWGAITK